MGDGGDCPHKRHPITSVGHAMNRPPQEPRIGIRDRWGQAWAGFIGISPQEVGINPAKSTVQARDMLGQVLLHVVAHQRHKISLQ